MQHSNPAEAREPQVQHEQRQGGGAEADPQVQPQEPQVQRGQRRGVGEAAARDPPLYLSKNIFQRFRLLV